MKAQGWGGGVGRCVPRLALVSEEAGMRGLRARRFLWWVWVWVGARGWNPHLPRSRGAGGDKTGGIRAGKEARKRGGRGGERATAGLPGLFL